MSLLAALLIPAARGSLRNVGIKVMESSMDFADQTRSAFGKAREGFEDMIAEANFNSLQDHDEFATEVLEQPPRHRNGRPFRRLSIPLKWSEQP